MSSDIARGVRPEPRLSADAPNDGTHIVGAEFAKEKDGEHGGGLGTMTLYCDDQAVATGNFRIQSGHHAL